MEDEDVLEENSIEDLLDEPEDDGNDNEEDQNEGVLGEITVEDKESVEEDEEALLSSELEFGEDPEYDDSVDDFDKEEGYSI